MERTQPLIQNIPSSYVAKSKIHGQGLFSGQGYSIGELVGTLDGQLINVQDHPEALSGEWNGLGPLQVLYRRFSTDYSYINHLTDPNLSIDPETMEIIANRAIEKGDEFTLDYTENGLPDIYREKGYGRYLDEK
jgi:hypothetical protein